MSQQLTWAKNKFVLDQLLVPFDGLTTDEIRQFADSSDERCRWAKRLSVEFDDLPVTDRARTIIDQQVGRSQASRLHPFCEALQQIAQELLGDVPTYLTAKCMNCGNKRSKRAPSRAMAVAV